ncbi:MAG: L-serine ammonia-lyase [Bdellovibrionales bacterium]|nr:L-serine ammonia-lyase [Bdellovibrionales bacterium]
MLVSAFELFKLGIGPSSSHTVGPMKAAYLFAQELKQHSSYDELFRIRVELFGSLGLTGKGHGTDKALVLGLEGYWPETVDDSVGLNRLSEVDLAGELNFFQDRPIAFSPRQDIVFHQDRSLSLHPNGISCIAENADGLLLLQKEYFSVGGGFVLDAHGNPLEEEIPLKKPLPYPFSTGEQLLNLCRQNQISISQLVLENEKCWREESEILEGLFKIWKAMEASITRGCHAEGVLPGGLNVRRRASALNRRLQNLSESEVDSLSLLDFVNLYALAVSEENAAGGRVVTAPTNGAAGIVPAVLAYYQRTKQELKEFEVMKFFLAATAVGALCKKNASISGAEVGCQGEVGVACSMAAAGLAELMGGTPAQVENAAEIAIEHNLGLTCDPVGGLVQIPCIERNAMGAVKAINAARIAVREDGVHKVSLDKVIETLRQTGADMQTKYKETAQGGLAVNIIEC